MEQSVSREQDHEQRDEKILFLLNRLQEQKEVKEEDWNELKRELRGSEEKEKEEEKEEEKERRSKTDLENFLESQRRKGKTSIPLL